MPLRRFLLALLFTCQALAQSGTVPADRPRARPPSALTGRKGEELLKRIQMPSAPDCTRRAAESHSACGSRCADADLL